MRKIIIFSISVTIFYIFNVLLAAASDRTDALDLMKKCENESLIIEVNIRNFGDDKDSAKFDEGKNLIKMGKVKVAQSNYLDAKTKFNEYFELQYNLYKSLAEKYIKRTEILIDEISMDLADFVSRDDVLKIFEESNNYLKSAKTYMVKKDYEKVLGNCKYSKYKLISIYELVGKKVDKKYLVDLSDYEKKIYDGGR